MIVTKWSGIEWYGTRLHCVDQLKSDEAEWNEEFALLHSKIPNRWNEIFIQLHSIKLHYVPPHSIHNMFITYFHKLSKIAYTKPT